MTVIIMPSGGRRRGPAGARAGPAPGLTVTRRPTRLSLPVPPWNGEPKRLGCGRRRLRPPLSHATVIVTGHGMTDTVTVTLPSWHPTRTPAATAARGRAGPLQAGGWAVGSLASLWHCRHREGFTGGNLSSPGRIRQRKFKKYRYRWTRSSISKAQIFDVGIQISKVHSSISINLRYRDTSLSKFWT